MRIALQDLLAGKDPRVWKLSPEMVAGLERYYADVISRPENRVLVAVDSTDRPVAMLMVRIIDNPNMDPRPFGRIDDAWVDPEWRRHGVMTALTRAACLFLAAHDVQLVMLDWANNNPPSGEAWQRIGFRPLMTMGFANPADIARPTSDVPSL